MSVHVCVGGSTVEACELAHFHKYQANQLMIEKEVRDHEPNVVCVCVREGVW